MSAQAFVDAGFLATGSSSNPYTETVQRAVNFVTEKLAIMSFTLNPKDGDASLKPENRSQGHDDRQPRRLLPEHRNAGCRCAAWMTASAARSARRAASAWSS